MFCLGEHRHRDVAFARDVCAGRFIHAGKTMDVSHPQWRDAGTSPDSRWWEEFIQFRYGLDLAFAFVATGEVPFLRTWQTLVRSWVEQTPAGQGPTGAIGGRMQNWIYAWNIFRRSPAFSGFDADLEQAVIENTVAEATRLQSNLSEERHRRTEELYALFVVALAFPECDADGERLRFAWQALHEKLLDDFRPDGVHREHPALYTMAALEPFLAARENARRFELPVPAGYDDRLTRAVEFAMFWQRPDGSLPSRAGRPTVDCSDSLALAAELLERKDILYVATDGQSGTEPLTTAADFPGAGYYVHRSAWHELQPARQRHLLFDCGPPADAAGWHCGLLSIDAWAGRPLVVDPGRVAASRRDAFKSTATHNTVWIDGLEQIAPISRGSRWARAVGRPLTRLCGPMLEVIGAEALSPSYDVRHRRHVFFVADDYWIVLDELAGTELRDYDLRFHLAPDASTRTAVEESRVIAPGVELLLNGPGTIAIEEDWAALDEGTLTPVPVVSWRAQRRRTARFVTAIVPTDQRHGSVRPSLAVSSRPRGPLEITLTAADADGRYVDRVAWRKGGAPFGVPGYSGIAEAVWTRTNEAGAMVNFAACGLRLQDDAGARSSRRPHAPPEPRHPGRPGRRRLS